MTKTSKVNHKKSKKIPLYISQSPRNTQALTTENVLHTVYDFPYSEKYRHNCLMIIDYVQGFKQK